MPNDLRQPRLTKTITVRFTEDDVARIDQWIAANTNNASRSEAVRSMVLAALKMMETI